MAIVIRAVSVIVLMFIALTAGVIALAITDPFPFLALDFEVMSALANVGWSHGLTGGLSTGGAMILVVLMFLGRLGPMMVALTIPDRPTRHFSYPSGQVRIG